ncbi:hypothetical protein COL922a_014457, partial [Colletotrichum nupharicola]
MAPRAASPALSENDFDITSALFKHDSDSEPEQTTKATKTKRKAPPQPPNLTLDFLGDAGDSDEDDEAFIASQQTSANRKSANLKGRTVKKG